MKRHFRLLTFGLLLVLAIALVQAGLPPARALGSLPGPVPGVRPTIVLDRSHGYAGQAIEVSGQAVAPYPGVRVAWLLGNATQTAAVIPRKADNRWDTTLTVPADAAPGAAQICAALTGAEQVGFACANFTVDTPPPGSVRGQLPMAALLDMATTVQPQAVDLSVRLYARATDMVLTMPVAPDGSVQLESVPVGDYDAALIGASRHIFEIDPITINPGEQTEFTFKDPRCDETRVSQITATPRGPASAAADFGTYVSLGSGGSPVNVTFTADALVAVRDDGATPVIERVDFAIRRAGQSTWTKVGSAVGPTWSMTYNVSQLPAGISSIRAMPWVEGVERTCSQLRKKINVVADPMDLATNPILQPGASTTWDAAGKRYKFKGTLPKIVVGGKSLLPLVYPDPPKSLPLVGTIENRLDVGLRIEGTLDLDGGVRLSIVQAKLYAKLFSQKVVDESKDFLPTGADRYVTNPSDMRRSGFQFGPEVITSFDKKIPVYSGPIWSFLGIVTVNLSVSVGIAGKLELEAVIRPLVPALSTTIRPSVTPQLGVSVWLDFLRIASGGADATVKATLGLPVNIDTEGDPALWLDSPCFRLQLILQGWASVGVWKFRKTWHTAPKTIIDEQTGSCGPGLAAALAAGDQPDVPRVMAAPSIASGPDGKMLMVYVDDATPSADEPTSRIMGRFWNLQANAWSAPVALSDGSHTVDDPVAAFGGPNGAAIVAWTKNKLSRAQQEAAGPDVAALARGQEIVFSRWDPQTSAWSIPQALTDDELPDGRPAIAGDNTGISLAWTRDTDGELATSRDGRIGMLEWLEDSNLWSELQVLGASNANNWQVSVARQDGMSAMAWTADADGDFTTNEDRRIVLASTGPNGTVTVPEQLPAGADSPALSFDPNRRPQLAFLVRGKDGDGETVTGIGDQAELWTAAVTGRGFWVARPVLDHGQPVHAEQPRLDVAPDGSGLLLFRHFGEAGTNAELGQLALVQLANGAVPVATPLYLTDETRQHWQPALAVNVTTGEALMLNVGRMPIGADGQGSATATGAGPQLQAASIAARPAVRSVSLAGSEDTLELIRLPREADPAVDPAVELSQQHAPAGTTVDVRVTVRNLGLAPATGLRVRLFSGKPGSGTPIATQTVVDELGLNDARELTFRVSSRGGEQPLYAEVVPGTPAENRSTLNDRAVAYVGAIPAPTGLNAVPSERYSSAVLLNWMPPSVPGVAGYRILRSAAPGGPYELVGESTETTFSDLLLKHGRTHHYVVEAYDLAGVLSPKSNEASAVLANFRVSLPMVRR